MHRVVSLAGFSWACIQSYSIGSRLLEVPTLAKILAANVIRENGLPPVAPIHQVVNGARILDSQRARHGRKMTNGPATSGTISDAGWTNLRFDPFHGLPAPICQVAEFTSSECVHPS